MQTRSLVTWLFLEDYEFWIKYATNNNAET